MARQVDTNGAPTGRRGLLGPEDCESSSTVFSTTYNAFDWIEKTASPSPPHAPPHPPYPGRPRTTATAAGDTAAIPHPRHRGPPCASSSSAQGSRSSPPWSSSRASCAASSGGPRLRPWRRSRSDAAGGARHGVPVKGRARRGQGAHILVRRRQWTDGVSRRSTSDVWSKSMHAMTRQRALRRHIASLRSRPRGRRSDGARCACAAPPRPGA